MLGITEERPSERPWHAQLHACASVLYAQIYEFDGRASGRPGEWVSELHRLYTILDECVERHSGCCKVRGSSTGEYIVASNVVDANPVSHADDLVALGMAMIEATCAVSGL